MKQQHHGPEPTIDTPRPRASSANERVESNQSLLDDLDLPGPEALADTGQDWLVSGLDTMGSGLLGLAADNEATGVQGSFVHLVAAGVAWAMHEDEDEVAVRQLMEQEGLAEAEARMWVENLAGVAFGEDPCWEYVIGPLQEWRGHIDLVDKYCAAALAISTPDAHVRPADSLREFAVLFEFATAVVPSPPGFEQFLGAFGQVMRQAADVLDELAGLVRAKDGSLPGVGYPGAQSGGWPLRGFLRDLRAGGGEVDDGVLEWLRAMEPLLAMAISEPIPFPVRKVLGHEFIDRHMVDKAAILTWCKAHYWEIAEVAWGKDEVLCEWGTGQEACD